MSFALSWDPSALHDMKRLPRDVQLRILAALEEARTDPVKHFRRLKGTTASRLRVGDSRVVADVVPEASKVFIHAVGHRRSIYG